MIRLEWVFLMQLFMGIVMVIFLQKIVQIKRQIDDISKEVMRYISYVTEEAEQEFHENLQEENEKNRPKRGKDIEQNSLIQAVLGEFFP